MLPWLMRNCSSLILREILSQNPLSDLSNAFEFSFCKSMYSMHLTSSGHVNPLAFIFKCGYIISINDALFMLCLSTSLFAANKFVRQQCDTLSEIMEYPKRKWVN
jgi:hypothetical protein